MQHTRYEYASLTAFDEISNTKNFNGEFNKIRTKSSKYINSAESKKPIVVIEKSRKTQKLHNKKIDITEEKSSQLKINFPIIFQNVFFYHVLECKKT